MTQSRLRIQHVLGNGWALFVSRLIIGGVFICAALGKIIAPYFFADSMAGFKILPEFMLLPVGIFFIWEELLCGILVLIGFWTRTASTVICGMLTIFFIALASALMRGLKIDCGCFGVLLPSGVGAGTLLRTFVLFLFSLHIIMHGPGYISLEKEINRKKA